MITLVIPELTPSLNVTRRGHWSTQHKRRQYWSTLVLVAKSKAQAWDLKFPKARVTIERYGGKSMDQDNLYGSVKDLVDGLRDNGLIENDDPEHLALEVLQFPGARNRKRTVVRIQARMNALIFRFAMLIGDVIYWLSWLVPL